jgi:serine/threonine protein kinase
MGEVYRARDTTLGRDVALKGLPDNVANDADRTARFRREAQILASLNHPLIAAIYGVEDSGATPVLVLELVEGMTLADGSALVPCGSKRPSASPSKLPTLWKPRTNAASFIGISSRPTSSFALTAP